jgi:RNA polymerase sigma factor (sigma-70 family)
VITIDSIAVRHKEWRKMALYLGATAQNVEDIIQDFYIKIIEINSADGNLKRITGENGKLHTMYVFKIIQSNVVNDFRSKKKDIFDENYTDENEVDGIQIELTDSYSELMAEIKNVIDGMREYDQMLLELYFVYGFSFREIEKRTSIPTRSVFNIVKNAKELIRQKTQNLYDKYSSEENEKTSLTRVGRYYTEDNSGDWD